MRRLASHIAIALLVLQVALILVSWLVEAALPDSAVHSLLSSEGIRWLFATFTDNILTPLLVWLLLGSMAYGALRSSGLLSLRSPFSYRQRFALRLVAIELVVAIVVILLLTAVPHAVLLSVTGELFPSSFSDSIVIVVCIVLMAVAVSYGLSAGTLSTVTDAVEALVAGIGSVGVWWLIYILGAELYASCRFVLLNVDF